MRGVFISVHSPGNVLQRYFNGNGVFIPQPKRFGTVKELMNAPWCRAQKAVAMPNTSVESSLSSNPHKGANEHQLVVMTPLTKLLALCTCYLCSQAYPPQ